MLKNFLFSIVLCLTLIQGSRADTDKNLEPREAAVYMEELGNRVVTLLTNQSISVEKRTQEFRDILDSKFNMKSIAKFVLGRYWKQATEEERDRFVALLEETTSVTYATRFQDYSSEKLEIIDARLESDGGVTVLSRILRPSGEPLLIDWKLFKKKGKIKIYDVILEGISMGITQRSEFASVIQKGGGQIQALLKALAEKKTRTK